jgi:hypothetical protein
LLKNKMGVFFKNFLTPCPLKTRFRMPFKGGDHFFFSIGEISYHNTKSARDVLKGS